MVEPKININKTPEHCSVFFWKDDFSLKATASADFVSSFWWIGRVLVDPPKARGNGVGGYILEELKRAVKEMGGTSLLVSPGGYAVDPKRQFKFYLSHGFIYRSEDLLEAVL